MGSRSHSRACGHRAGAGAVDAPDRLRQPWWPLNLLGAVSEQPDFLAHSEALPFVLALRGDPDWKHAPQKSSGHKVSPLVLELWKVLDSAGVLTAAAARETLGRELTEAAVLRALCELWQGLRISPVFAEEGQPTSWEMLRVRHREALATGAATSQVTAISLLVSMYLQSVYAASSEEIEIFLSPVASRSRVREAVRGLSATRQIHSLSMDAQTYYFLEDGLPEFAEPALPAPRRETPSRAGQRPSGSRPAALPVQRPAQRKDLAAGQVPPAAPPAGRRPGAGPYPARTPSPGPPHPQERSGRAGPGSRRPDLRGGQRVSRQRVDRRDAGREKREAARRQSSSRPCLAAHHRRSAAGPTRRSAAGNSQRSATGKKTSALVAARAAARRRRDAACAGRRPGEARSAHRRSTYPSRGIGPERSPGGSGALDARLEAREGPERPAGPDPIVLRVVLRDRPPLGPIVPVFRDARQAVRPPFRSKEGRGGPPRGGPPGGARPSDSALPAGLCLAAPAAGGPPATRPGPSSGAGAPTAVQSTNGRALAAMPNPAQNPLQAGGTKQAGRHLPPSAS